jgi:hypothetical protein
MLPKASTAIGVCVILMILVLFFGCICGLFAIIKAGPAGFIGVELIKMILFLILAGIIIGSARGLASSYLAAVS